MKILNVFFNTKLLQENAFLQYLSRNNPSKHSFHNLQKTDNPANFHKNKYYHCIFTLKYVIYKHAGPFNPPTKTQRKMSYTKFGWVQKRSLLKNTAFFQFQSALRQQFCRRMMIDSLLYCTKTRENSFSQHSLCCVVGPRGLYLLLTRETKRDKS